MVFPLLFKNEITEGDIIGLKGLPSETDLFDIKSTSYTVKPDDVWKQEICEDISAFANARGGLIVLGVTEDASNRIGDPCGLGATLNVDAEIRRLKQAADSGIVPIVPGLRFLPSPLFNGTDVAIAIQVPRSFVAPHKVVRLPQGISGSYQVFKIRRSNGNADMSLDELRMAFNRAESYVDYIRNFRAERIEIVNYDHEETPPAHLPLGIRFCLHVTPLTLSERTNRIDLRSVREGQYRERWFHSRMPYARYNFDGLLIPGGHGDELDEYTQVFRGGAIETIKIRPPVVMQERKFVTFSSVEAFALHYLRRSLAMCINAQIAPPLIVMLSLSRVEDCRFVTQYDIREERLPQFDPPVVTQDTLLFPEISIEDYAADYKNSMKQVFDTLWNVGAREGSESYDANGSWTMAIEES